MDKQSGFNLLQAAVLDGEYNIVLNAHGLLGNFVEVMELVTTGNNAKHFPGKTAVDILSLIKRRKPSYCSIERLYNEWAKDNSRLTKMYWATCHDDVEQAVEFLLKNDCVDINAPGSNNDWTALLRASRSSSSQFIEALIDLGADVNGQRIERKKTSLILAANWNNYMAAYLLVRHGADVNVQISKGFTSLHLSVQKNHENLIKLLLANKVDVNIQDNDGYTPLHWCTRKGNENLCRLLLEHNAGVNFQDNRGYTPLNWCAREGKENLCRLLLEHNADVNIQDNDGYTPLNWCAREGKENLCRLLLEHNADVNIQDAYGSTPLHRCASKGNENICRLLLEHNMDVNIQDNNGSTPLHRCAREGNENICRLLLEHNADVNIKDNNGYTALYLCALKGNENLCRLLLEHNADVNIQDAYGSTPLHLCARHGNENLGRLFLEHNADLNIQDNGGCTPLHRSALNSKDSKIIDLLVKFGEQNINIRNANGLTPLQMAVEHRNAQAVKMLVDLGADVSVVEDAFELKRLKNEAESVEQHLKFEMGSAQKANETKYRTGVGFVRGAEKLTESHPKSEKVLRQSPSYTYTTKEIEEEPEAEQVKTLAVRHPKSKATTSSRTNKCVMA